MCGSLWVILEFYLPQYACIYVKLLCFQPLLTVVPRPTLGRLEHGRKQGCLTLHSSQRINVLDEICKGPSLRNTKLNETERALKFDGMLAPFLA